ncbi:uncharacterized protein [Onthophagus taurus]|uniref:uncharacterized protein n=1 Tax=Onthophagus taurus TaxID=166361 RepID=UPI000C1FF821|nr:uncharacterized protein LOC111426145 [Onthophagus taurus]XP_022916289.1 uncharacterized protein LOC111426145 [Onthophagus taurus]XP_022916290.1 uncharacterized protein LOC111426145 [Onthophagus taurus]XP_022916291.1 uncharacterized protein LOC111426145 [Onthophagus taurus]
MTESVRSSRKSSKNISRSTVDVAGSSKISLDFPHEETDFSAIYSIRDELINSVLDECMKREFEKLSIKYIVNCAYEAIKRIIELEFNMHDFGKEDFQNDPVWKPDQPPICSPPDTWAASNVPVVTTEVEEPSLEKLPTMDTTQPRVYSESFVSTKDQTTDQTDYSAPLSLTSVVEQYLVCPNTSEVEIEEYTEDDEEFHIKKEKSLFTTLMTCSTESNHFMQYSSSAKWKDQASQKPQKSIKSMKSIRSVTGSVSDKKASRLQNADSKISINSLPPLRAEAQLKIVGSFTKEEVKKDPKKKGDE